MSAANWIITDISTAPIVGAVDYLGPVVANRTLKDPEKIAADIAKKERERGEGIFDIDLLRITGIGTMRAADGFQVVELCKDENDERAALRHLVTELYRDGGVRATMVGYNALAFDWPVLRRRARYLGVPFPEIVVAPAWKATDRDLYVLLKDEGGAKSLGFYVQRLGWNDLQKPLSGAEESKVHETGQWDALEQSLKHDVIATYRLGLWMGVL